MAGHFPESPRLPLPATRCSRARPLAASLLHASEGSSTTTEGPQSRPSAAGRWAAAGSSGRGDTIRPSRSICPACDTAGTACSRLVTGPEAEGPRPSETAGWSPHPEGTSPGWRVPQPFTRRDLAPGAACIPRRFLDGNVQIRRAMQTRSDHRRREDAVLRARQVDKGPPADRGRWPVQAGRGRGRPSPREAPGRTGSARTWLELRETGLGRPTSRTAGSSWCRLEPLVWGQWLAQRWGTGRALTFFLCYLQSFVLNRLTFLPVPLAAAGHFGWPFGLTVLKDPKISQRLTWST